VRLNNTALKYLVFAAVSTVRKTLNRSLGVVQNERKTLRASGILSGTNEWPAVEIIAVTLLGTSVYRT